MNKRKLTLSVDDKLIKTLKVKAIQHEVSVSQLVEVFALVAERDKKLFKEIIDKYIKILKHTSVISSILYNVRGYV